MFTGIVRDVGRIVEVSEEGHDRRMTFEFHPERIEKPVNTGQSIAVDGVCLTVTDCAGDWFTVNVSSETLDCTNLGNRTNGDRVNIEPSLEVGDSLGGHFVFGHVDEVVTIKAFESIGEGHDLSVEISSALRPYLVRKGSVALDGISLTVNDVTSNGFTVRIVPHTIEQTSLKDKAPGDQMNIEVDMLARYVGNYLEETST